VTVKEDLNKLIEPPERQKKPLGDAAPPPGISEAEGFGAPKPRAAQRPGTGSIAAPLTEVSYNDRQWFDEFTIYASDGFFSLTGHRIKQVTFKDANGSEVPLVYKDKPTE
jgi:hypothetical protein